MPDDIQGVETTAGSRRQFLGSTAKTMTAGGLLLPTIGWAAESAKGDASEPLKIGVVGCGHRGTMLGRLFRDHGGFSIHAVADYFQEDAEKLGNDLQVDAGRRFSGLSGYKRVIDSGIDAIALETPPGFFPQHATAAVDAGLHVYMAKPVAVDVPGCQLIEAAAKKAAAKKRLFFVDLQMHTDSVNHEVAERVRAGGLGKVSMVSTRGISGGHADPPLTSSIASRLRKNVWDNDVALSGGHIAVFSIHCIDAAIWVMQQRPTAASSVGRFGRVDPHGDARDVYSVLFEYGDGLIHEHTGQHLPNGMPGEISCRICGPNGHAMVQYTGEASFAARGEKPFVGEVVKLYPEGARRNVASFHRAIVAAQYDSATVQRALDSTLACILGREAFDRQQELTMKQLIQENRTVELDLRGLQD